MNPIRKIIRKILLSWSPKYGTRVGIVMGALLIYVGFICYKTFETFVIDREHYTQRIEELKKENVLVEQMRGVIFSETGEMIAASLPQYDIYFDFRDADDEFSKTVRDTVNGEVTKHTIKVKRLPQDTIDYYFSNNGPAAQFMHQISPKKSSAEHAAAIRKAYKERNRRFLALRAVPYLEYKKLCTEAPFFSKSRNVTCIFSEERPFRYRPFGETRMAAKAIGGVLKSDTFRIVGDQKINYKGHGLDGLEKTFDHYLAGEPGNGYRERVKGKRTLVVTDEPVDGADVYTTLDMEMESTLDKALNDQILRLNAFAGWAAVMEVETGKIKAISNLKRIGDHCIEDYNHFVQDRYDPGSTFKTVSYMVLLEDGKITPDTWVDTGNYPGDLHAWQYHGKQIRDDHAVGRVTANEAMAQSSNIALAKLTTNAYENDQKRYLDHIREMRIFEDLHLDREFDKALPPKNRDVKEKKWSKVSLAQMSYGYESEIPGMYMLNFYNAIANGGKLMRPYIVDRIEKDGKVIEHFEPEVINASICSSTTLKQVKHALECVVDYGTARTDWNSRGAIIKEGVKSQKIKIAGKTGTAQRYANGSYSSTNGHYVSFAGYFPADKPQYSIIVVIDIRPGSYQGRPGGGYMAGPVVRNFAEQVYARLGYRSVSDITPDSANVSDYGMYPKVKRGPEGVTASVIDALGLSKHTSVMNVSHTELSSASPGHVPDVCGMGAVDALYLLESAGLNVSIIGRGKVVSQTIPAGSACQRGQTIAITLK